MPDPGLLGLLDFLDPREIIDWLGPWATLGLFAIIFAESGLLIGFFLPGDSLLFTAGLIAAGEDNAGLHLPVLLVGCFLAAVIGDQVGYWFGKKAGPALFRRPDSRLFKQEYVHRTKTFFEVHGPKTILLARFVPVVRTFAPILAGVGEMPYGTFFRWNVIGGFIWAVGVTTAGYLLGDVLGENVDKYLLPIIAGIIVLSLLPPLFEWRKHRKVAPLSAEAAEAAADDLAEAMDED